MYILFVIHINNLEESLTNTLLKCSYTTKHSIPIKGDGAKQQFQNDIDKLTKWSEQLQMLLNVEKCKYRHTLHGDIGVKYDMGGVCIRKHKQKTESGVTMHANMNVSEQTRIPTSRGHHLIGV